MLEKENDYSLIYIELTDFQKNLDKSLDNATQAGEKMSVIFKDIRTLLKITNDRK
jgi:hypothetical protein